MNSWILMTAQNIFTRYFSNKEPFLNCNLCLTTGKKLSENKGFFRIPYMYIYSRTWTVWGQSVYTPHCSIFFSPPLYYNDSWTKYQYNVNTILGVIHYEGSFVSSDQYKQLWFVNELEILRPDNSFRPLTLSLTSGSLALGTAAIWMT